jgi:hypothetical protein
MLYNRTTAQVYIKLCSYQGTLKKKEIDVWINMPLLTFSRSLASDKHKLRVG